MEPCLKSSCNECHLRYLRTSQTAHLLNPFRSTCVKSLCVSQCFACVPCAQFKVCPKSQCVSTPGHRTDLFLRDPGSVLITDFFGSVRKVELTVDAVDLTEPISHMEPRCVGFFVLPALLFNVVIFFKHKCNFELHLNIIMIQNKPQDPVLDYSVEKEQLGRKILFEVSFSDVQLKRCRLNSFHAPITT